jgi:hypothetical protein
MSQEISVGALRRANLMDVVSEEATKLSHEELVKVTTLLSQRDAFTMASSWKQILAIFPSCQEEIFGSKLTLDSDVVRTRVHRAFAVSGNEILNQTEFVRDPTPPGLVLIKVAGDTFFTFARDLRDCSYPAESLVS